ncbi:sugar transferase [Aneurinibacillus sp. Ricciae_BoGa-3]|uniref:sugar transferase n=1 Tax=Aneurinibacillus sp. Ricciae_BoGa-3 TaxID=3022697 RepID=UPI00233FC43D|nr:sugar transferase [Aneurinibacillus sp. Ricciae_BoGa-3]WCK54284.1 sugar transferase [Aneurinibacillus sp. Ricciae_BoGa-3]
MPGDYRMRFYKVILALFDIFLVNIGFIVSFWVKFVWSEEENSAPFKVKLFGTLIPQNNLDPYIHLIPWISAVAFIIFYMFDLYSNWRRKSLTHLLSAIFLSIISLSLITMAITFWYRGFAFPRSVLIVAAAVQVFAFAISRTSIWYFAKRFYGKRQVVIIDAELENGLNLVEKFLRHAVGWFIVKDFILLNDWKTSKSRIDSADVVLIGANVHRQEKAEIISFCAKYGKEVLVVPELYELFILGAESQQIDDLLVLSIQPPKLTPAQLFTKRIFDLVFSGLLLVLLSPVMLLVGLGVRYTSPGPVIFKQERLGRNGVPYTIYKFRSMVNNAEKISGPVLATSKDPRITRFGSWIRATRLDEIPQLFNVFKGDMSLVGPRPERSFFIQQFQKTLADYSYRMSVKPGITGLAQVMAKYSTTAEDKLRFDLMYVRGYSFGLDIKILLQTLFVVFRGEQAAGVTKKDAKQREELVKSFNYGYLTDIKYKK